MSARRSLTWAVRDQLRAAVADGGLALEASECDVMADGYPAPGCGQRFVAIHQGQRTNRLLTGDESEFGVTCTVSYKTSAPFDRIGTAEIDVMDGLDDLGDAIWNCIFAHQWGVSPTGVMNKANEYLLSTNTDSYPWVEALYPSTMSQPTPVREEWFNASRTPRNTQAGFAPESAKNCGFSMAIQFVGAKRLQRLGDASA